MQQLPCRLQIGLPITRLVADDQNASSLITCCYPETPRQMSEVTMYHKNLNFPMSSRVLKTEEMFATSTPFLNFTSELAQFSEQRYNVIGGPHTLTISPSQCKIVLAILSMTPAFLE